MPGTTTFALRSDSRVSSDSDPLYLPLVWHSAQRALMTGTMSCAKSIFFGVYAWTGASPPREISQATSQIRGLPNWTHSIDPMRFSFAIEIVGVCLESG